MKSWRCTLTVLALSVIFVLGTAGCTSQQLRDKSDEADNAATKITTLLDRYEPGQIEESELARAIIDSLPAKWQGQAESIIDGAGDVRMGASEFAAKLNEVARNLEEQADEEASKAENAVFGVMSVADLLLGTNGLLTLIGAGLWKRKRDAENATQDIVASIQSSPTMRAAVDGNGGQELRQSMQPQTMKVVRKIKDNI